MINIIAVAIFALGYVGITFEHRLKMNKSSFALLMGSLLWVVVAVGMLFGHGHVEAESVRNILSTELAHSAGEIFEIVIFLLAAMSLVEVLVEYQFFDLIRGKIFQLGLSEKRQFWVLGCITFFLSAIIDNLTTTIVMITIARKFFKEKNLTIAIVGIVIAANAGGAFSPLGDVTTIILWLAGKFSATEIMGFGFLPSLTIFVTAMYLLSKFFKGTSQDASNEIVTRLTRSEKVVVSLIFFSFTLPFAMSFLKLPPYIGLLIGLGIVWIVIDLFKQLSPRDTHMEASIEKMLKKTDLASLKFFIGVLLAVSALNSLGILDHLSEFLYGSDHNNFARIISGNVMLGMVSAILDNVPLTAIAIKVLVTSNTQLWVLLAITVGTGGSLLSIGSAAGVIAMGMHKEMTFANYFKYGFVPALVSYTLGVLVWYGQYLLVAA